MANRRIYWYLLDPQLTIGLANDPQQISTTRLIARTVLIYNDRDNTGRIFLADTAAKITSGNAIKLDPNEGWELHPDNFDNVDQWVNLTDWYYAGDTPGDKLIVEILYEEEPYGNQ